MMSFCRIEVPGKTNEQETTSNGKKEGDYLYILVCISYVIADNQKSVPLTFFFSYMYSITFSITILV